MALPFEPITEVSSRSGSGRNCFTAASAIPIGPPVALLFTPGVATSGVVVEELVVLRFTKQLVVDVPHVDPVGELA